MGRAYRRVVELAPCNGESRFLDPAVSDGKAKTGAARLAITGIGHTIERPKDIDELGLRNARAVVANCKAHEGLLWLTGKLH